jgi:hypothetical protein
MILHNSGVAALARFDTQSFYVMDNVSTAHYSNEEVGPA